MHAALITMLTLQDRMNTKVHPEWVAQQFEWYRAAWIECAELMDHYGYKWWKKQEADVEQVQLEVIDIWHFGLSALFVPGKHIEEIASDIQRDIDGVKPAGLGVREATEALAEHCLRTQGFSVPLFWELMLASGLDFQSLYTAYVGKNVLNFFRQDHGYKDGTYVKNWAGREDNEHLVELSDTLDTGAADFSDQLYAALKQRYEQVTG